MIGLSNVSLDDLRAAQAEAEIVSIQNRFSVGDDGPLVDVCAREGLAFIPYFPLRAGAVERERQLRDVASRLGATPFQVALAWLLKRSPNMLPIPGTSSLAHLEENLAAASVELPEPDFVELGGD